MKKFLDLGNQPLANSYLKKNQLNQKEKKFRLEIGFNPKNFLVSILNTVPKEKMFNKNYPYKSSESFTMRSQFQKLAVKLKKKFKPKLLLEIGSNDGAFIKNFKKEEVIGIEPCKNLAKITKKKGYKTYSEYWDIKLAKKISSKKKIDLIYSANTLSHIKNISEIFKAINLALTDNGVLVLEDPSLLECMRNLAYDQFYCEHIYVFSTLSLQKTLEVADLEIFDVENLTTHGGSNRYYIKKKKNINFKISSKVKSNLSKEKKFGLNKFKTYKNFANKVKKSRFNLEKIFNDLIKKNKKIIGYGATAKSCTVLNYCNINYKKIDYFYDTTSFKIGSYLPGSKIPIRRYQKLDHKKIDYVFLGAWNFKDEIFKKEKEFIKNGGKFFTHVPFPHII
jgi:2-polyprenyl-3-methyl-5-hydroxy-6-metoxy-1,4-benzoquinol methylase